MKRCVRCGEQLPAGASKFCAPCYVEHRAEYQRERMRQARALRAAAEPVRPVPVDRPQEVLRRVLQHVGPDSAAALAESMNSWRRLNGVPEVRL